MTWDELWILRITVVLLTGYGFAMSILWLKARTDLKELLTLLKDVKDNLGRSLKLPESKKTTNTTDTSMDEVSDGGD